MDPLQISEEPIAYSMVCGEELENIRSKLLAHMSVSSGSTLNFSGQIYNDSKRQIYEIGTFCKDDNVLLNFIESTCLKLFRATFIAFNNTFRIERRNKKKLLLFVRCRLVKDNPGYFLAPHNDSTDTLFAFLLPIKKSQQPTSSFRKIRVQSLLKSVYPRKSDAIAFFTTRYQCESMTEISDQFQRNSALTIHYCRKRNLLITVSDSVENYNITVWRCRDLTVLEDEVLIIPNSTNKIFDSHLLTPAKLLGAHGVLPTIEERINLLADVLCLEIDDNQREIGFKQNKKEVMFSVNL